MRLLRVIRVTTLVFPLLIPVSLFSLWVRFQALHVYICYSGNSISSLDDQVTVNVFVVNPLHDERCTIYNI